MDERDPYLLRVALESAEIALDHRRRFGPEWRKDLAAVDAIAKRVEEIGEAAFRLSRELKDANPDVPWKSIEGMRHRLVHAYPGLDVDVLERVVERDLPSFIERLREILRRGDST